jgi:hypothetical protein
VTNHIYYEENTMKRLAIVALAAAVVVSGVAYGQEPQQPNEHMKGFAPLIGVWRYEGPLLEDAPGLAEKGSDCVIEVTFRRILDKQVVTDHWAIQYAGGKKVFGRGLSGWNAAENKIVRGSMDSLGSMSLGTIEIDAEAKTNTLTAEIVDGEGRTSLFKAVFTKTGKDTITWKALERDGGDVEGESPVYTYKRVKPSTSKRETNTGQVPQQLKDFAPFIGTWRYEGRLKQAVPGLATADTKCVLQCSWRRILDKQIVMYDWMVEFEGGQKLAGKSLIGWNVADEKVIIGGMDSVGGIGMGTVVIDREAKTMTASSEGVDGEGDKTTGKNVVTKTAKDALTFQIVERTGGLVEGPSPVYEFKRVKRPIAKKAAN